jgi:integrase
VVAFAGIRASRRGSGFADAGGREWVRDSIKPDGRRHRVDAVQSLWRHYAGSKSVPLKLLRKTSASLLDRHAEFGRFVQHFLGHAPQTVATTHYVRPAQDRFDEAMMYLAKTYGFTPR